MEHGEIDKLKRDSVTAFRRKQFALALEISEKLVKKEVPGGFYTCALILENGWGGIPIDLQAAYALFKNLAIKFNSGEGYLGCVRIILKGGCLESGERALAFTRTVKEKHLLGLSHLLSGRIYEELYFPPRRKEARCEYFRAFAHGSSWGLRKLASSYIADRRLIAGAVIHIIATLVAPLFFILGGKRSSRSG
jgi:TPR repeat protein